MENDAHTNAVREKFIEKMAEALHKSHVPPNAARIFAMLIYDGDAVSFTALAERLDASRGSVSQSVRMLETVGIVTRKKRDGDRQDYFQLADNAYVNMLQNEQTRSAKIKAEIAETIAQLDNVHTDTHKRLHACANFYEAVSNAVKNAEKELRENAAAPYAEQLS